MEKEQVVKVQSILPQDNDYQIVLGKTRDGLLHGNTKVCICVCVHCRLNTEDCLD